MLKMILHSECNPGRYYSANLCKKIAIIHLKGATIAYTVRFKIVNSLLISIKDLSVGATIVSMSIVIPNTIGVVKFSRAFLVKKFQLLFTSLMKNLICNNVIGQYYTKFN